MYKYFVPQQFSVLKELKTDFPELTEVDAIFDCCSTLQLGRKFIE